MPIISPAHRESYWKPLLAATGVALLSFLLYTLFGPDPRTIHDWITHTGLEGELEILPELSIIDGADKATQEEKSTMASATQGIDVEVVEERPPDVVAAESVPVPAVRGLPETEVVDDTSDLTGEAGGLDPQHQMQMQRPSQHSLDFVLVKLVRPRYPAGIPRVLAQRTITVHVAIYVETDGKVSDAYVVRSDGGPAFDEACLRAVLQWEYQYVGEAEEIQPMWDQVRWIFTPVAPAPLEASGSGD